MVKERLVNLQFHVPYETWVKLRSIKLDKGYRTWQEVLEKELLGK